MVNSLSCIVIVLFIINSVLLISYSTKINFGKATNSELQKLYQKEFNENSPEIPGF